MEKDMRTYSTYTYEWYNMEEEEKDLKTGELGKNYMNAFVNTNQKHLLPVGNLFALPTSDKMYYVNQKQ